MGRKRKSLVTGPAGIKAAAYCRVSTVEQGLSIEAQAVKLKAYADMLGLELVTVFAEQGVSGSVPLAERPEGAKLVAMVQAGAVQHILGTRLDRMFRSAVDCLTVTRAWDLAGVTLHLTDMGGAALNTGTAVGRLFLTMTSAFAELERSLISERTSTALKHKQARGEWTGAVPRGARVEGKRLVVDGDADGLRLYQRATALRRQGMTFREIAAVLVVEGFKPIRGRELRPSTVWKLVNSTSLAKLAAEVA